MCVSEFTHTCPAPPAELADDGLLERAGVEAGFSAGAAFAEAAPVASVVSFEAFDDFLDLRDFAVVDFAEASVADEVSADAVDFFARLFFVFDFLAVLLDVAPG